MSGGAEAGAERFEGVRFSLTTLGCTKNQVDSEAMRSLLTEAGHRPIDDPGDADVVIVNTC